MDYIFKEWEKKLSAFEDSVEKKLEDIRKCKEEVQQLKFPVIIKPVDSSGSKGVSIITKIRGILLYRHRSSNKYLTS